jgi:hypothetical protein
LAGNYVCLYDAGLPNPFDHRKLEKSDKVDQRRNKRKSKIPGMLRFWCLRLC